MELGDVVIYMFLGNNKFKSQNESQLKAQNITRLILERYQRHLFLTRKPDGSH